MRRFLLDNDSSGGGGGADKPDPTETTENKPPAPPPAASTVIDGTVTEETVKLRKDVTERDSEIARLKKQLKDHEITICEYQDKLVALQRPAKVEVKQGEVKGFTLGKFRLSKT